GRALGHAVRQFLDGNGLRDDDFADDFDLLLLPVMQPKALAFSRPAHRSQAAHSLSFVARECARDRDFSGAAARVFATDRRHGLFDLRTSAAPRRRHRLFLLLDGSSDLACRSQRRHFRGCRLSGPLGHLTPRVFLLASLRLLFGSLASLLFYTATRLLLFHLSA